jgi:hypothetical protein
MRRSTVLPGSGDTSPCSQRRRSSAPRSSCAATSPAAIGLYRAVGFKVEGVKRDALRLDGGRFDLVVMALQFDGGG